MTSRRKKRYLLSGNGPTLELRIIKARYTPLSLLGGRHGHKPKHLTHPGKLSVGDDFC